MISISQVTMNYDVSACYIKWRWFLILKTRNEKLHMMKSASFEAASTCIIISSYLWFGSLQKLPTSHLVSYWVSHFVSYWVSYWVSYLVSHFCSVTVSYSVLKNKNWVLRAYGMVRNYLQFINYFIASKTELHVHSKIFI